MRTQQSRQDGSRHGVRRTLRHAPLALAAGVLAGCASGSAPVRFEPSKSRPWLAPIDAEVSWGRLRATLPADLEVLSVAAAAKETLERRGYAVRAPRRTVDSARLVATPPGAGTVWGLPERITFEARRGWEGVEVDLRTPIGEEAAAADLFDEMLTRLGR